MTGYTQPEQPVYELSGWWRRAGAEIIDWFIVAIVAGIVSGILGLGNTFQFDTADSGSNAAVHFDGWALLVYFGFSIAFMAGVMAYSNGQTLGMMATSIRVVREDGSKINFGFAFYRENVIKGFVFGWLAIFTLYIATLLNYLWPLWDDGNQALHDKICNTRVVRDRHIEPVEQFVATPPPAAPGPPPPPPVPGAYQPPPGFENPVPEDKKS